MGVDIAIVYHGTRSATDLIKNGLKYPGTDDLIYIINRSFDEIGMSFENWIEYQKKLLSKRKFNTFAELDRPGRRVVWVTDREDNAWSYAKRSPEIVSEAIRNEYIRINYRRKNVYSDTEIVVDKALSWIGKPKVVVLDAKMIGAGSGVNQPIAGFIPPDAIINILIK
jgi:hypothetical protein